MQDSEILKNKNTKQITMYDEMSSSYLSYAMSVIVSRALPDVRDGLKPVHRRILYAMYKGGFDWSKQFRKSARVVGDVIGKYHPHGDQAVYDALVRMVQDFSMSLPLIDGQGNFGSVDGDPAAAMRYTETKLAKVSQHLIDDIEKQVVHFKSNYDETEKEPEVLPSQFPNILVNGAGGIAVGMATSIPPHNLKEVINGTLAFIENKKEDKKTTLKQLMQHIKGPDFPTKGIIIGQQSIKEGYDKGKASSSFKIRGNIDIEQAKAGRERLVISSIPYQVNKSILTEKIAQLVREKKIEGIKDIRDESNSEGIRLVIDLRNGVEPETIKRLLYKNTSIESSFGFNMLAIVNGKPEQCGLIKFLDHFLNFREDVVLKKTKFELKKAESRSHILIGLSVSVENIDKIIKIIIFALIGSILLTISAKIKIPFYPVPMTMQTFIVLFLGISFGYKVGVLSVVFYLIEGIMGLPVFSNSPEKGIGLAYFVGPTMGYLIGFIFACLIAGIFTYDKNHILNFLKIIIATSVIYILGILWLGNLIGWDKPILEFGVYPFLYAELFKILLLTALVNKIIKLRKYI